MPPEVRWLWNAPVPLDSCPACGADPFEPFMRGMVQRSRDWFLRPSFWKAWFTGQRWRYCALICWTCKEIVGWE